MCSSRISTRCTNTRSSWDKKIFAPLFLPFEPSGEVVVLNVLKELLANPLLDILCGFETLSFKYLNIGGDVNTPDICTYGHAGLVDPPFGDHAIGIEPLV